MNGDGFLFWEKEKRNQNALQSYIMLKSTSCIKIHHIFHFMSTYPFVRLVTLSITKYAINILFINN